MTAGTFLLQRARDKLFLMQRTMAAGGETSSASENVAAPSAKVSRADAVQLLQFGVAGALAAQDSGRDPAVTSPQVKTLMGEVVSAMQQSAPSVTVGVGGRKPSAPASAEALAAAAGALTTAEERVEVAPEQLEAKVEDLGRGTRERTSRFTKVGEDLVLTVPSLNLP